MKNLLVAYEIFKSLFQNMMLLVLKCTKGCWG